MSETENQHHHHHHHKHHHHKHDGASRWKRKSLLSIERRKTFLKWFYRFLIVVAVILFIAVIIVYSIN